MAGVTILVVIKSRLTQMGTGLLRGRNSET